MNKYILILIVTIVSCNQISHTDIDSKVVIVKEQNKNILILNFS